MRLKKNQERRLHRKNAKIVKEGGTPMQLNRPVKPDTTVSTITCSPFDETNLYIISAAMWSLWANGSYELVESLSSSFQAVHIVW